MVSDSRDSPPQPVWVYAYKLSPPQAVARLQTIQPLLADALSVAKNEARTWAGTVVLEERVTHILVVSDSPEQNHEGNRKLESELQQLGAEFSITAPMALP
jgi:hypothetical protein